MSLKSSTKHFLHCMCLFSTIIIYFYVDIRDVSSESDVSHGILLNCILIIQQYSFLLCLPMALLMILGLVLYNTFPDEVKLLKTPKPIPFVCVRTVTRGLFPELVLENVIRNMRTCYEAGLEDFVIEVVTDKPVKLPSYPRLRETVVPADYKTRNGTLFKARALQFCLEEGVNLLGDNDWIVHLDEETIMTPSSVRGIANFILQDKHQLGQGMITYANERVVNWITTLADTTRIADDLGVLRFQLRAFHRLLLVWKGSFLVVKAGVERKISFDHGPSGSIAEDITFGMMAAARGYSFDFIEGEMWEKSPFTLMDFIRQRSRWTQGCLLITLNKAVPYKAKFFVCYSTWVSLALPFVFPTIILAFFYPMTLGTFFSFLRALIVGIFTYTFVFGILRSFSLTKLGIIRYISCMVFSFFLLPPIKIVLDSLAIAKSIFSKKLDFYIVDKKTFSVGIDTLTV